MYVTILHSCLIAWCFLFTVLQTGVAKSAPQLTKHAMVSDEGWLSWKVSHGKEYVSEEEELVRYLIWVDNMHYIEIHNKNADKHGYTLEINHFGDMVRICIHVLPPKVMYLPLHTDWRRLG